MQKLGTSRRSDIPQIGGDEEESLVNNANPNNNGYMENPSMPLPTGNQNDHTGHDLEIIDRRLENDYTDKEIYSGFKEAGCFKKCYVCCGNIPKKICCICAPCGCGPVKTISQGEIGLLIRFGRVFKKLPPGLHTVNSCTDKLVIVDMRLNSIKSVQ